MKIAKYPLEYNEKNIEKGNQLKEDGTHGCQQNVYPDVKITN